MKVKYSLSVLVACSLWLGASAVFAKHDDLQQYVILNDTLTSGSKWTGAQPLLEKVQVHVDGLGDYTLDSLVAVRKDDKITTNLGSLFFKKDRRIRVVCKSGSVNKGAVVVLKQDGHVRAAGGGMLKFMKMNLEEDSRMLMLDNGFNILKSDLAGLLHGLTHRMKGGYQAVVTVESVKDKAGNDCKVVEVKKGPLLMERIVVREKDHIPIEWDLYKGGELFSVATFDNFKGNPGLSDNLFDL
jgi:outer membrane lipoprotein-sorting protein